MTWNVFYSYAHDDEVYRERLVTALAPLRQAKFIAEWHDRKIEPGADWNAEIASQADSADLFLVLLSPEFLASDYCQGVEMERAFARVKKGTAKVLPILLRPCLWEVSTFSAIQMIPRDANAITSWPSIDEAYRAVAKEIHAIVSAPRPQIESAEGIDGSPEPRFDASMELVRRQLRSYARQYERIRLRMRPSNERTSQMESLFQKMRSLAARSVSMTLRHLATLI
jgi:TIR domain